MKFSFRKTINLRSFLSFVSVLILIFSLVFTFALPVKAEEFDEHNFLSLIDEPENLIESMTYFEKGEEKQNDSITWTDGIKGKAVSLNGNGQTLVFRNDDPDIIRPRNITLAGFIKWNGAPEGLSTAAGENGEMSEAEKNIHSQRIFSFTNLEEYYRRIVTVKPFHQSEDGKINGVYLKLVMGESEFELSRTAGEHSNFALSTGKWHHFALTMDGEALAFYIDGVLVEQTILYQDFQEMRLDRLVFGGHPEEEVTLNALLDSVVYSNQALSPEAIALLANNVDLNSENPTLPTNEPLPTAPPLPETTAAPTTPTVAQDGLFKDIPSWVFQLAILLFVIFLFFSVMLTVYKPPSPPKKPKKGKKSKNGKEGFEEGKDNFSSDPPADTVS